MLLHMYMRPIMYVYRQHRLSANNNDTYVKFAEVIEEGLLHQCCEFETSEISLLCTISNDLTIS